VLAKNSLLYQEIKNKLYRMNQPFTAPPQYSQQPAASGLVVAPQ